MFHPTHRDWALAASWTSCEEFGDEPCRIFKELYWTKNLGLDMSYITNYVFDFEWGVSKKTAEAKIDMPAERIFVTRDPDNQGHQQMGGFNGHWDTQINLFMSDDFYATDPVMLLESGNTLVKTNEYMFVAASHSDETRVTVHSSNYKSGFQNIKKVKMPDGLPLSRSFTLMDTSEQQVFLFLQNHGHNTVFGNLYISDSDGRYFALSMDNVIKGEAVDFEKVNSLDGTFIINRYDSNHHKHGVRQKTKQVHEFNEADMIAEEEKKASRSRMGLQSNIGDKQKITEQQVNHNIEKKIDEGIVEQNVKTYITHNKGASWELIKAPTQSPSGKAINCYIEDGCSIHLEIYSHLGELSPVYSAQSAVGIVLGTGNMGTHLTENNEQKALFLSRDGGL